jgi:hypothetical protein
MVITWNDFWSQVKGMPVQTLSVVGQELGDDFPDWIKTRTPKVQQEILHDAPETFQKYLYTHKSISRVTVMSLGIDPKMDIYVRDNRSKK